MYKCIKWAVVNDEKTDVESLILPTIIWHLRNNGVRMTITHLHND